MLETTLQLDAAGDPKYVVTLGRPTIGWSGEVVTAVVLVDPVTGEMQRIPRARFDELPAWVSRVYPDTLVLAYNDWFGRYVHGFWNSLVTKRDVHLPARAEVYGMIVEGNRFVWFVDHTSPNATDDSMTGFTYTDSRTGAMTYYTASGGQFNSGAAERSVSANPIVTQGRMIPTTPILYNIAQNNTWVVPAVAANGKFQTLALVQATGGHVVVGSTSAPAPVADAFAGYRAYLGGQNPSPRGRSAGRLAPSTGSPPRGGRILFTLRGRREIYAIGDPANPPSSGAQRGQRQLRRRAARRRRRTGAAVPRPEPRAVRTIYTSRLRLEPVDARNARELWTLLNAPDLRKYQDIPRVSIEEFERQVALVRARSTAGQSGVSSGSSTPTTASDRLDLVARQRRARTSARSAIA